MKIKFIDGTTVSPEYLSTVNALVTAACEAENVYSLDELEEDVCLK